MENMKTIIELQTSRRLGEQVERLEEQVERLERANKELKSKYGSVSRTLDGARMTIERQSNLLSDYKVAFGTLSRQHKQLVRQLGFNADCKQDVIAETIETNKSEMQNLRDENHQLRDDMKIAKQKLSQKNRKLDLAMAELARKNYDLELMSQKHNIKLQKIFKSLASDLNQSISQPLQKKIDKLQEQADESLQLTGISKKQQNEIKGLQVHRKNNKSVKPSMKKRKRNWFRSCFGCFGA